MIIYRYKYKYTRGLDIMAIRDITVSSSLKSMNTESAIRNHNGNENRGKVKHENEEIDITKSHFNIEIKRRSMRDLLHEHYDERIERHNKNNNSEARRWDLDRFLDTFQGKTVKAGNKQSRNERWATVGQIIYLGGKDTLNPIIGEILDAGATPEEFMSAYSAGYEEYVDQHNEMFPTLPIYQSNIHFDETTPHGHDAIVVMGHTKKGLASDSLDNALGEIYGYGSNFKDKADNLKQYREDNDTIVFNCIGSKIENLALNYGLEIDLNPIRTGQEGSLDGPEYKKKKRIEDAEKESLAKIEAAEKESYDEISLNYNAASRLILKDEKRMESLKRQALAEQRKAKAFMKQVKLERKKLEDDKIIMKKERADLEKDKTMVEIRKEQKYIAKIRAYERRCEVKDSVEPTTASKPQVNADSAPVVEDTGPEL